MFLHRRVLRPLALLRARLPALSTLLFAFAGGGCASIPKGMAAIDTVTVRGNAAVSSADIEHRLVTTASPRFLGIFQGVVYDYELFDRSVFQRDLERVARYYRARGYYETKVRAGRVERADDEHVDVTIDVEEGRPVLVRSMHVDGLRGLSKSEARAVRKALSGALKVGALFEEEAFRKAQAAMRRALGERGRAFAKVERRADVDLPGHYANLFFTVQAGPKSSFGPIRIEGLGELPEGPVRRAIDITEGERYSEKALDAAERALLDLGTFSSVSIQPVLGEPPPPSGVVPIVVRVEVQKLRSVLFGGGLEIDSSRTEIHLRAGWEHRNLFGGFRHFTIDFRPGANLYPTRLPSLEPPVRLLPEGRLRAELRRPGVLEARTNAVIRQELNVYAVPTVPKVDAKTSVLGYLEYKGAVGLDRAFGPVFLAPSYNVQWDHLFAYVGERDPDLVSITLSFVDILAHVDLRDDRLRPHRGLFLQSELQIAGLGGDARDVRFQPEVRGYIPLGPHVTLAARATVGFLLPRNYGDRGETGRGEDRADRVRDIELMYLRGFFSGGPSSNRGYPLRGVGPHGAVPFFTPGLREQALARACDPSSPRYDPVRCASPLGGLSLWEASLELRFPIVGPLGGAVFCDASDVSPYRWDVRLDHPHLSCGLGLRYDTPIGPVRLDVGYRIPGLQLPPGVDPRIDGDPTRIYGLPLAFAFGIGEAF
ncbi:Outer membrane protein assembly factor YaeT precursor [Minicystis rosea]|nr:Outer membrane protein assembly factor YaeT precursor [Minicystis rosea]